MAYQRIGNSIIGNGAINNTNGYAIYATMFSGLPAKENIGAGLAAIIALDNNSSPVNYYHLYINDNGELKAGEAISAGRSLRFMFNYIV